MIIEDNIVNLSFINSWGTKNNKPPIKVLLQDITAEKMQVAEDTAKFYIMMNNIHSNTYFILWFILYTIFYLFQLFVIISILLKTKHENLFGNSNVPGTKTIFFKRIENYLPVHKSKSVHILSIFTKCNMYTIKLKLR